MEKKAALGETQARVLIVMRDLEWWRIEDVYKNSTLGSVKTAACAMARLAARGYLEKRPVAGKLPLRHEYRITDDGLEVGIMWGVIQ